MNNTDLVISKYNEAYIKIEADSGILMEISEAFVFQVDGYKFTPAYKMGRWDGKIRLFNLGKQTIYIGLLTEVKEFCHARGYTLSFKSNARYGNPDDKMDVTLDTIHQYIKSLEIASNGNPLGVRDYQEEAVYLCLKNYRGIIKAATGAGKSLIMYCLMRYLTDVLGLRALIIVPTTGLTTQLKADFADYSGLNGWSANDNVHLIPVNKTKNTEKPITISTFQSLAKLDAEYFDQFDCIFTDEGHTVTSKSITGIYERATKTKFRYACTGTLHDMKTHILTMKGLTGDVYDVASTKKLIDNGQLVKLEIKCLQISYPDEVRKAMKKKDYETEITYITASGKRNRFISKLAEACQGTTLILYRFVEHGKELKDLIEQRVGERPVYYVDGSVDVEERESIRQTANHDGGIVIASYGTFKQGINLPAIENIIFAHPMKSKISNLQSIGRGLRLKGDKKKCTLYDIGDDMSHGKSVNFAMLHFGERLKTYTAEGFDYKFVQVSI